MAGRFPGAPSLGTFRQSLLDGVDRSRGSIPRSSRTASTGVPRTFPHFGPAKPVLDGVELFEALFRQAARRAALVDPASTAIWSKNRRPGTVLTAFLPSEYIARVEFYFRKQN
jgi:acyl transferase domain-containing protein